MAAPDDTQTVAPPDYPSPQEIQAALAARGVTAAAAAAPPPSSAPAAAADPTQDYIKQQLALLQAPLPQIKPDTTPAQGGIVGLLGRIGMALAGGSVTDTLSPAQKERAGIRALGDFGTSLMAGSGYYPGKPMFGGLAQGFEGASRSEAASEQQAASYLGAQQTWQMEQQKLQMERLKEALPLLQAQYGATIPNPLLSANTPAVPGTAGGAGRPGGNGVATAPSGVTIEPAAFNNATAVRDGFIKRGIDADTATALAANALHESVANPATGRGDKGNSAGLFQWSGPRLQAYTDAYGHPPDGAPLDEQLDFVTRELKGSEAPASAQIGQAQGPAAKAAAVSQYYLRPKDTTAEMQRRSATALQLQQQLGGGTPTAAAGATQPPAPYKVATTGAVPGPPSGSTTAPADTTTTTADATPAAPIPPGGQTLEQFMAMHMPKPTPEEEATWHQAPDQATLSEAAAAKAAAAQAVSGARTNHGVGSKEESEAQARFQAASKDLSELKQKYSQQNASTYQAWIDKQKTLLSPIYQQQVTLANQSADADKQRAAAVALKEQEGNQAITLAQTTGDEARRTAAAATENSYVLDQRKQFAADHDATRNALGDYQMLRLFSNAAGTSTPIDNLQIGDKTGRDLLVQYGLGTQAQREKWGAQQAFDAVINKSILAARQGVSMGQLSDRDMNFLQHMTVSQLQDPQTRSDIISYLEQSAYRKQQYMNRVEQLWDGGKGLTWGNARSAAEAEMAKTDILPVVPANFSSLPDADKRAFIAKNNIVHGSLVRGPDGNLTRYVVGK